MPGQATVTIGDKQWSAVVANTLAEITTGLSGVESIPSQTGMLFDLGYDQKSIQIDMTRMLFPLDIILINSTQGVIGVMHNIQPGESDVRLENDILPGARFFLEVNAGEAEGIEDGDNVAFQGLAPQDTGLDLTGLMNFIVLFVVMFMMMKVMDRALKEPEKPVLLGGAKAPPGYKTLAHHHSPRRYGEPKGEEERAREHERRFGTRELPERGSGHHSGTEPTRYDVEVHAWQERDRLSIWVEDKRTGGSIAEWWDDEARQMFEDGFFKPGVPQYSWEKPGRAFVDSVLDYLEETGVLATERSPEKEEEITKRYSRAYLTNWQYGGYSYVEEEPTQPEKLWAHGMVDYADPEDVIAIAQREGISEISLAGGFWERIGYKGYGEKVSISEAKRALAGAREHVFGSSSSEHHSKWLTPEQRKDLEKKYGAVTVRWAEEATRPSDIKGVEAAAEYYCKRLKEVFGLGHLSSELTEEQLRRLRELLGLPADVGEVLKIHRKTGYIP